ncbi:MAG: glycosyltransferase family 39 protein [Planctomycetia bacterium]|nr:glycosyltransferase family 39 protein [Planctomycetia bacterium]
MTATIPCPAASAATSRDARRTLALVLAAATLTLAVGYAPVPLWDEDEPRFAVIARTMAETGDWIVPLYNGTLAVDKPVLMHWCMAAAMTILGPTEFAARVPSMLAALATALVLFRAGCRWFDQTTGAFGALAFVGCLLVGIESHAATPDAILVALTAWATVLAAEVILDGRTPSAGALPRLSIGRAAGVGLLLGIAVVCKGPIGFVGPLAVVVPWAWWVALERRLSTAAPGPRGRRLVQASLPAAVDAVRSLRPTVLTLAMLAAAAPWYVAVTIRTDGEWLRGFLLVHNVGRFMAPMERHGGGVLFHPLTMLVGFYPWSCFLPLALVVAAWRVVRRTVPTRAAHVLGLLLAWLVVWVGGFSAAATKLPNYVLPAYPAAALLVAAIAVAATRAPAWPHPRWLTAGLASLALGGIATAATIVVAARFGLVGAEPAALVGLVPLVGAAVCWRVARDRPRAALAAFAATALIYTGLACGPTAAWLARANRLPELVTDLAHDSSADIATYGIGSPNVVFYAGGRTVPVPEGRAAEAAAFLTSRPGSVLLVPEGRLASIRAVLPEDATEVARTRPLFRTEDIVAIGVPPSASRSARRHDVTR